MEVPVDRGPWFQRWPRVSITVAALLFAGIFALRLTVGTAQDATNMLYALPIALLAIAFGRRVGVLAGCIGVALTVTWVLIDDVSLSALGWTTRIVPMLFLGILVGDAAERLRVSEVRRIALDRTAYWHREAVEINDSIVQGLAVAKWALEAGDDQQALKVVEETLDQAHTLVSGLLREAGLAPGGDFAPGRRS